MATTTTTTVTTDNGPGLPHTSTVTATADLAVTLTAYLNTETATASTPDKTLTTTTTLVTGASDLPGTGAGGPIIPSKGRLYCICGGTRGDQQPLVMTAKVLKGMGYDITLCIGEEGRAWTEAFGFQYLELTSFVEIVERPELRHAAETNDFQAFMGAIGEATLSNMHVEAPVVHTAIANDTNAVGICCTSTHWLLTAALGRACGLPAIPMFLSPITQTKDYPPFFIDTRDPATWQSVPNPDGSTPGPFASMPELPGACNLPLWGGLHDMLAQAFLASFKVAIDLTNATDKTLDMPDDATKCAFMKGIMNCSPRTHAEVPCLFAYSPAIVEDGPSDATDIQKSVQMGFIFDRATGDSEMSPFSPELEAFLDAGSAPVYLGWGSMSREHNDELCRAAVGACKMAGKRGVILGGWAKLNIGMLDAVKDKELLEYCKNNIHFTSKANHIQLFPRCCATVTHAGMGTFGAMLRGGVPGIVCPVWWDQTFCGDRIEHLEIGKRGPHFAKVTAENLGSIIKEVLAEPKYAINAAAMRARLLAEKPGDEAASEYIDNYIQNVWTLPKYTTNWAEPEAVAV